MKETVEIDLRKLGKLLLKRIWIIVLCAVLVGAATLVYTANFVTPVYTAGVTIYVNNNSGKDNTYVSSSDLAVALRLVATYVNIIESDTVLEKVIDATGYDLKIEQLRAMLDAEAMGETEMFKVQITSPDPEASAELANTIAEIAPGEIAAIIEGSSAKIIDYARVPEGRSAPSYTTNTIMGVLIGMVLAVLGILIEMVADVRIKNEEDLESIYAIPVLGSIPDMTEIAKNTGNTGKRAVRR